jgi:urease accessory protein
VGKTLSPLRLAVAVLAWLPLSAAAHNLSDRYGDFFGALLHPLISLDHGLALLATGLIAGQQRSATRRLTVAVLIGALVLGVALGMFGTLRALGSVLGTINLLSVLVLGVLVALAVPLPRVLAAALAAVVGLSHGGENGLDLGEHAASAAALAGVGLAGAIAALPGLLLVPRLPAGWPRVAVRVAGSWIAAIGLIMLGLALRSS